MRAATSLPAPAGPVMSTRLLAGATRSMPWITSRSADESPIRSTSLPARSRSSSFSRLSRAASIARSISSKSRSDLNGFSMKS